MRRIANQNALPYTFRTLSIVRQLAEIYALRLPYHRGKWRVIEAFALALGYDKADRGKTFEVERNELLWRLSPECTLQRRLLYHGQLDLLDTSFVLAWIKPGAVFADVGSYFGYYALRAAAAGAKVFAFEPLPGNYDLLTENIRLNESKNIETVPCAVSDQVGEVSFSAPPAGNRGMGALAFREGLRRVTVQSTTLDTFFKERQIERLDVIKIDVEGAEVSVLKGAKETLARFRPKMLVEYNPTCLNRCGTTGDDLLNLLRAADYDLFMLTKRGLQPFKKPQSTEDYLNLICLPAAERKS